MRRVAKEKYVDHVRRSGEFFRSAEDAVKRRAWNAAVSNAVHAGISMVDALTVFHWGQRSVTPGHEVRLRLLYGLKIERSELDRNVKHLSALLEVQRVADYEDRLHKRPDATAALRHADRFLRWALAKLPGGG